MCFSLCEGLVVTSFTKYEVKKRLFEKHLSKSLEQYKKYKNLFKLEDRFNGIVYNQIIFYFMLRFILDLNMAMNLKYVRDSFRELRKYVL